MSFVCFVNIARFVERKAINQVAKYQPDIVFRVAIYGSGGLVENFLQVDALALYVCLLVGVEVDDVCSLVETYPKSVEFVLHHVSARVAVKANVAVAESKVHKTIAVVARQTAAVGRHPYKAPTVLIDVVDKVVWQTGMHVEDGEVATPIERLCLQCWHIKA